MEIVNSQRQLPKKREGPGNVTSIALLGNPPPRYYLFIAESTHRKHSQRESRVERENYRTWQENSGGIQRRTDEGFK